jgi:cytochrome o ubiquinol oxidase operon protein cyoD
MSENEPKSGASLKAYIAGFLLSIVTIFVPFALVNQHVRSGHNALPHRTLITIILIAAAIQFFGQLFFFLHLGRERGPRWKLLAFLLMLGVMLIVVLGSLWIMHNLDYNMMNLHDINKYMNSQDSL